MNKEEVPTGLAITEAMREAYAELNTDTPFSVWAQARLWSGIEEAKLTRQRRITMVKE